MDDQHPQPELNAPVIRRSGRVPAWVVFAIGVQFLLVGAANASDPCMNAAERTKVRRISESVVQVLRDLVDQQTEDASWLVRDPGFRVVESGAEFEPSNDGCGAVMVPCVRYIDLPPPSIR